MTSRPLQSSRITLLVIGALLCGGCSSVAESVTGPGTGADPSRPPVTVKTITVAPAGQSTAGREYVGVVEAKSATALSFPLQGAVTALTVGEGRRVREGQLLARLDEQNLQSMHNGAQAMLVQAEDAMKRLQMLYDNGSLPEIRYIEAQTKLEQARSMEQIARKNLDDSRLIAPFDGVIGRRYVETGENLLPGQAVYTLLKTDTIEIKIAVPENEIVGIGSSREAHITVSALGGKSYRGTVQQRGVVANPVSHTYEARIPLRNPGGELMPGMVCRVTLSRDTASPDIVLPNRVVQITGRGERFVWCVRDGKAVMTPVTVGPLTDGGIVITSGLEKGERVITDGSQKVSEGMTVEEL